MTTLTGTQCIREQSNTRCRSFGGCATCRIRHVKCDEGHPSCSSCIYSGFICGGYEKSIFFDSGDTSDKGIGRFRRPLLTQKERERMVESLTSSVAPATAHRLLSQIDHECENATNLNDFQVDRGPFGAFRLSQMQCNPAYNSLGDGSEDNSPAQTLHQINDEYFAPLDTTFSPWPREFLQPHFEQAEQFPMPFLPDVEEIRMDIGRIQEVYDGISMPEIRESSIPSPDSQAYGIPPYSSSGQLNQPFLRTTLSSVFFPSPHNRVPQDAVHLLNHYATFVISSLTPFGHNKTPWHILFLPLAKNCLASLTLGESLDDASLCAFYGILAISAVSLGIVARSQMWLEQGRIYKQQAREHIRMMLKTVYAVPKVAKYKTILMALTTMVQVSTFSGTRDQTECYLLEAEKFIRLRGLNRRKSRKVRMLHHCYVYMRMFHESTVICGTNSRQRHHVREAVESSGLVIYRQDNLSFSLMRWNSLDQEMTVIKSLEDSENDLHLGQPGIFSATLYPEIYGIPEPWFYLLSQVIRLGNEKDAAEHTDAERSPSVKDFVTQAKAIERCINQMQQASRTSNAYNNHRSQIEEHVLEKVFEGMQCALAIYFYRRIYNVDASMLQQKVLQVCEWLLSYESEDSHVVYGGAGFVWPAFIAACEAEDPKVQASFSNWFKNSAKRYGLPYFTETLKIIEHVWQERSTCPESSTTWLDLMRKNVLL